MMIELNIVKIMMIKLNIVKITTSARRYYWQPMENGDDDQAEYAENYAVQWIH